MIDEFSGFVSFLYLVLKYYILFFRPQIMEHGVSGRRKMPIGPVRKPSNSTKL
jgi:hypothetical protein